MCFAGTMAVKNVKQLLDLKHLKFYYIPRDKSCTIMFSMIDMHTYYFYTIILMLKNKIKTKIKSARVLWNKRMLMSR